jgi:hypothetical protein
VFQNFTAIVPKSNQIENDGEILAGSPEKLRQAEEAQYDQVYEQSRSE